MPSIRVDKELNNQMYFVTFTVKHWYYIFDRYHRWDVLLHSLQYCQTHKQLEIYAYVFMLNHIHLIVKNNDMAGFIRDFKKYTSYEIIKNMRSTEPTVATLFEEENGKYSLWQKTNMPKIIVSEKYFWQKKVYIENNPVRKGYVVYPEHWQYSSAFTPSLIEIKEV